MNAAISGWPHQKDVVILVNPAKRKKIASRLLVLAVVTAALCVLTDRHGPVSAWAKEREIARLTPAMERAMENGSPSAALWLATYDYPNHRGLLEKLAEKGDPEALYRLGTLWTNRGEKAKGLGMMHDAAIRGNANAIVYEVARGK